MSTRETTLSLRNLLNALVDVAEWENLAAGLEIKSAKVKAIKRNNHDNLGRCKYDLLDHWLRSDLSASWEKLIDALQSDFMLDEHSAAIQSIRTKYLQGAPGRSVSNPMFATGSAPLLSGPRVMSDGGAGFAIGVRQPVVVPVEKPADELMHTQQIIEAPEEEGGNKLVQVVMSLSDSNFDVDQQDIEENNSTILHHSAVRGDLQSIKALVAFGANVNIRNSFKQTPLDLAKMLNKKKEIITFLSQVGGVEGVELEFVNSPRVPIQEQQRMEDDGGDQMREEGGFMGGEHLILSLDYSSTMALVQLEVLHQLEKIMNKKITDMFEWIVASGVGGFLMMAMIYKKKSVSELRRIYFRLWQRVFSGRLQPKERGAELDKFAKEVFGQTLRMGDCDIRNHLGPKLLIAAVNKGSTDLEPFFFRNFMLNDQDERATVHVWKVARYTCSSPLFIGESDNYVDGGAVYKNPSIFAFTFIRDFYRMQSARIGGVVSIGDGKMSGVSLATLDEPNYYSLFLPSAAISLGKEISTFFASILDGAGLQYQRINPLLDDYIPVPEQAKMEQLINAVIRTIVQCRQEKSEVQDFSRKFNNLLGQNEDMQ